MYEAIAFLQEGSDVGFALVAERLARTFPEMNVAHKNKDIIVSTADWQIKLHLNDRPYVLEESKEMAEYCKDRGRAFEISRCARRVEIWSVDPDPNMDHFNDYVLVCQVLEEFKGVILFDPQSGELI